MELEMYKIQSSLKIIVAMIKFHLRYLNIT
jgi:hypothetical protein